MVEGFFQVPFNDTPALLAAITPSTAAILLEPIQGESGIKPADARFLQDVRDICDKHGLLMMLDEVQCGLGRTGNWCGWKSIAGDDIMPDAISWAKGIAGGFPLGAIWVRDKKIQLKAGTETSLADLLGPGSHGTTFGGTPLVCAGANEVLEVIENEGLLENAGTLGLHAKRALGSIDSPLIKEVRGVGLMIGHRVRCGFFIPHQSPGFMPTRHPHGQPPPRGPFAHRPERHACHPLAAAAECLARRDRPGG